MSFFGELDVESVPAQVKRNKPVGAVVGFPSANLKELTSPRHFSSGATVYAINPCFCRTTR